MIGSGGLENDMRDLLLDPETVDRLLAGRVDPDDAPPGYSEVATLLTELSNDLPEPERRAEAETVAAMAEIVRSSVRRIDPPVPLRPTAKRRLVRAKIASLVVVGTLGGTTGLAFAGALPDAAQDVASAVLAKVGITVPGANPQAGSHPDGRQSESPVPATASQSPGIRGNAPGQTVTKGSEISDLARTTTATGVNKGATISTAASDGKSRAGDHGSASSAHAPKQSQGERGPRTPEQRDEHGPDEHGRSADTPGLS